MIFQINYLFPGDYSEKETPDPMPNSAVKLFSADGTTWETMSKSKTLPGLILNPEFISGFFYISTPKKPLKANPNRIDKTKKRASQ